MRNVTVSPRRLTQTAVWLFLAAIAITSVAASGLASTPSSASEAPGNARVTVSAATAILAAGENGSQSATKAASLAPYYKVPGEAEATASLKKDAIQLLPAWRYQRTGDIHTSLPSSAFIQRIFSAFASIFLFISAFIWSFLLWILKFALSLDLARSAGEAINQGFRGFAGVFMGSGIIFVLAALTLIAVLRFAFVGAIGKVGRSIIGFLIPVALLFGLTAAAGNTSTANPIPKGSPAWLAITTADVVDTVGSSLGQGFGLLPSARLDSYGKLAASADPNCMQYFNTLYNQYDAYSNPVDDKDLSGSLGNMDGSQAKSFSSTNGQLKTLSRLWERAWLSTYTSAQFGDTGSGNRIVCHRLEDSAGINPEEQRAVALLSAGYPSSPAPAVQLFEKNSGTDHEAQMFGWAACNSNGSSFEPANGWKQIGELSADDCKNWWRTGELDGLNFKASGILGGWFGKSASSKVADAVRDARAGADASTRIAVDDAFETIRSFKGETGASFISGFISILVALVYAWVLGALGIGTIIAQLAMVLLLVLLPGTLTMMAMPTKDGSRGNGPSRRMLRLTAATTFAKLLFTVILVLLMQTIALFESLLPQSLTLGGIGFALAPLAALVVLKKLLKEAGLGDISKLSGALGMASAGALGMGGNAQGRGFFNKAASAKAALGADTAGKKLKTDRADAAARKVLGKTARAPLTPARFANTKYRLGERAALMANDRKVSLFGAKDKDGNRIQYGMAQQLSTFAGALSLARGNRRLNSVIGEGTRAGRALSWAANSDPRKANMANMISSQRAERRALMARERGMSLEQKLQSRRDYIKGNFERAQVLSQLGKGEEIVTDANGNWQRDSEGRFQIRGTDGQVRSSEEFFQNDEQFLQLAKSYMDTFRVKPEQFVMARNAAIGPTLIPLGRDGAGRLRFQQAKTEEATMQLARSNPNMFIEGAEKRPAGLSDDAFAVFQWQLQLAAGLRDPNTGAVVDVMKDFGVDVDTEEGKAEFRKALSGEPSRLDRIRIAVDGHSYSSALAFAREYDTKSVNGTDTFSTILKGKRSETAAVWTRSKGEQLGELGQQVNVTLATLADGAERFTAASNEYEKADRKYGELEKQISLIIDREEPARVREMEHTQRIMQHDSGAAVLSDAELNRLKKELGEAVGVRQKLESLRAEQQKVDNERSEVSVQMRVQIQDLLSSTDGLGANIADTEYLAKTLEFSNELMIADKRHGNLGEVIDKADIYDKQFVTIKAQRENLVLGATSKLLDAMEGDVAARREAMNSFLKQMRALDRSVRETVTNGQGYDKAVADEIRKARQLEIAEKIRQGIVEVEGRRSGPREVVGSDMQGWRS